MTSFVGMANGSGFGNQIVAEDDERLYDRWITEQIRLYIHFSLPVGGFRYDNMFWPRTAAFIGSVGDVAPDVGNIEATWRHLPQLTNGTNSRMGIVGVTRDAYGSPLGGVTVKLFRTSDDSKIDQQVSDPLGNFLVSTPLYPDQHYLVTYKTGSPDVFGSSVNSLIAG